MNRRLSTEEAAALQGFPVALVKPLVQATSEQIVRKALGDSMSINVLSKVMLACLRAIGKIESVGPQSTCDCKQSTCPKCGALRLTCLCCLEDASSWPASLSQGATSSSEFILSCVRSRLGAAPLLMTAITLGDTTITFLAARVHSIIIRRRL